MRVLIVGDGNHYFNRKLVEHLKANFSNLTIDFFTTHPIPDINDIPYDKVYDASINIDALPFFLRLRGVLGQYVIYKFSNQFLKVINANNYDIVHLQNANFWVYRVLKHLKLKRIKVIVTIWGSDFYRASRRIRRKMKDIFDMAEKITFASAAISKDFDKVYSTGKKHEIVKFGLDLFDSIDRNRLAYKKSIDKKIVTIGYNRQPAQQHIKVIESLNNLSAGLKDKLKLIIPFTYGPKNEKYYKDIQNSLAKLNIEYEFLNNFITEDQLAYQRLKSDIMIQVQITDAFSGSMQEYMFADNAIITGSWLPYSELEEKGVKYITLDSIEEIPGRVTFLVENFDSFIETCNKNQKLLRDLSSWESNIQKWGRLYK
jgi:hypothetical protein